MLFSEGKTLMYVVDSVVALRDSEKLLLLFVIVVVDVYLSDCSEKFYLPCISRVIELLYSTSGIMLGNCKPKIFQ